MKTIPPYRFRQLPQLLALSALIFIGRLHATPVTVNDASGTVSYSGSWTYDNTNSAGYYNSDQHYSSTSSDSASFTFTGTSVQWIGPKNIDCGISQVYLDGTLQTTVDMYAPTWLKQQVLYASSGLSNTSHTIKIQVTHTKNAAASGYYSSIDAFVSDNAAPLTLVNDTSTAITYSGAWTYDASGGAINGDQHLSSTPGDSAQFTFTGTTIQWLGPKNISCGIIDVYLDTVKVASVDMYATTWRKGEVLYSNSSLTNASHTIKLVVTNAINPANTTSPYYTISVDAFAYGSPTIPTWNVNTTETNLTLALVGNQEVVTSLKNPTQNWNWAPSPVVVPLMNQVNGGAIEWVYRDTTVNSANGTQVILRYINASPALELKSMWTALPGGGPVEHTVTIANNTGGNLTFNHYDLLSSDLTLTANNPITLTRYDRCRVNPAANPVFQTALSANTAVSSTISNSYATSNVCLPFQMLDVGGVHGLYIGYQWSFGQFLNTTDANALAERSQFYLGDSGSFIEPAGSLLTVPAIFYGTYHGDTDDGSNAMKSWFWTNRMTPTLRNNSGEPLVEYIIPESAAGVSSFFGSYAVSSWGGELAKIDINWLAQSGGWFGTQIAQWLPDATAWPSGFTGGSTVHSNGQLLSLYMPHTYQYADLATAAGVSAEEAALQYRYTNYQYDYYRSDFILEAANGYLSHQGYLQVLDYMIANNPNFRYEHCSAGGSLKDFTTLQRMTFMTTEDSSLAINDRQAIYACSYMINPVQLKTDIAVESGPGSNTDPAFVRYIFRTGFMGANMATTFGGYTSVEATEVQAAWPLYKNKQRPILRHCNVYHILPVADGTNWDGMEYFNPSLNQGSVLLFRPGSSAPTSQTIIFKGLNPSAYYILTFQDRTAQNVTVLGSTLMTTGLTVTGLTGSYASEIIWIN